MIDNNLLSQYNQIKWDKLLRKDLGPAGQLTTAEPVFNRIKTFFDIILNHEKINSLPDSEIEKINIELASFISFLNTSILNFSDVSLKNFKIKEVVKKEWQIILNLKNINQYFFYTNNFNPHNNPELATLKTDWNSTKEEINSITKGVPMLVDKLAASIDIANKLTSKSDSIDQAINSADEWIKKNDETIALVLRNNSTDVARKAEEHITYRLRWVNIGLFKNIPLLSKCKQPAFYGSFGWIVSSLFFGLIVMLIIGYYVFSPEIEITIGLALLRISAILVPSYFTVFSAQQYLAHRKLYESYRFKDVSINTMINLKKQISSNDRDSHELLLKKTLDVLFLEPVLKDEDKFNKQIVLQLLEMIKK